MYRTESKMPVYETFFSSEWLGQVMLLDGIHEGLSEDTRSDAVMAM